MTSCAHIKNDEGEEGAETYYSPYRADLQNVCTILVKVWHSM